MHAETAAYFDGGGGSSSSANDLFPVVFFVRFRAGLADEEAAPLRPQEFYSGKEGDRRGLRRVNDGSLKIIC